jgi:hypothetical protein
MKINIKTLKIFKLISNYIIHKVNKINKKDKFFNYKYNLPNYNNNKI